MEANLDNLMPSIEEIEEMVNNPKLRHEIPLLYRLPKKVIWKEIIRRYDLIVEKGGKTVGKTIEFEKGIKAIKGVQMTSDKDDLLFFRGFIKMKINDEEYFPKGYESKLLMSSLSIPPLQRFYILNCSSKVGFKAKLKIRDEKMKKPKFKKYRVSFYFQCILES